MEIPIEEEGFLYAYLSNEPSGSGVGAANSSTSAAGVPVYFDDFTIEQQSYIVQVDDYYLFGMTHRQPLNNPVNKYLWNGKERVTDLGLHWDFYGLRNNYDPILGRFHSVDPLADAYVDFSPYAYVLNNPLKFVDLDGKKVLYVNGYWQDSWLGRNIIGSSRPGRAYWGSGFVRAASQFFDDGQRGNGMFIDGSSQWGGDESGSERYTRGYEYAKEHYDELIADMQQDETFKLVTHSEGGAFGAGIAQYLLDQGKVVETILHLSTDEADEFSSPENTTTYQLGYGGDWVTGNKEVTGVDVFGIVDKFSSNSDKVQFAHGSTKGPRVFNDVKALLKAAASGSTGVNVTETSSGVRFEFIRVNEDEQEEE